MLQVRTVKSIPVEKHRDRLVEGNAVLLRVGRRFSRVPLEHLFSIYVTTLRPAWRHQLRVRTCANDVVARVRPSTLLNICPRDSRQFTSIQQIDQLEALAAAIPWRLERGPLRHQTLTRLSGRASIVSASQLVKSVAPQPKRLCDEERRAALAAAGLPVSTQTSDSARRWVDSPLASLDR